MPPSEARERVMTVKGRTPPASPATGRVDSDEHAYDSGVPRRAKGVLLPIEEAILSIGLTRQRRGDPKFHGFAVARELADRDGAARLLGHGTLYKALDRLERDGLLVSEWEDLPEPGPRPRRRLYEVTGEAAAALTASRALRPRASSSPEWAVT